MAMNVDDGLIRGLDNIADLLSNEVVFEIGEIVEIKGCRFEVRDIRPSPYNTILLEGKARISEINKLP